MRLQRIKVAGFLGHQKEAEVDFGDADLWLVHGANGSGKSSFWDALLYAFFAKKRGGINLVELIHDCEPKAEIRIGFILNGQLFQIWCEIKRQGRNNRILQTSNGDGWQTIANGDKEVSDWIKKELQISPETFTSAVLLQQGKADAFFTALPAKRKEVLLELLNLKFYRDLGGRAAERRKRFKRDRDELDIELKGLPNPSKDEIKVQEKLIDHANASLKKSEGDCEAKKIELQNARNAKQYQDKIGEIEREQEKIAELVKKAASIEAGARRFRELERVLLPLEDFWRDREAIENKKNELAQFTEVLQKRDEIEKDFVRYEILRENLPLLHQLKRDEEHLQEVERKFGETERNLERSKSEVEKTHTKVAKLRADFDKKEIEKQSIQNKLDHVGKQIHSGWRMLETRSKTEGADECAFCGSELKTEEAKARLAHKHEIWEKEITELETENKKLSQKFTEVENAARQAKTELEAAERNFHKKNNELIGASTILNLEEKEVEKCRNNLRESFDKADEWSGELKNLENLVGEYDDLRNKNVSGEKGKLQNALTEESKAQGIISLLEQRINENRGKIRAGFLSVCEDKGELEKLQIEKAKLQSAESEEKNLLDARDRQIGLESDLKTWRGELDGIPSAHRRPVEDVEYELAEISGKIDLQKVEVEKAREALGNLKIQLKTFAEREAKLQQTAREFELWKKLADSLGKGKNGLESVLIQKAQEQIKFGANDILRRLSKMRFEIDLKEISENELEIRVQDNHTNSSRSFENYSGGEKFCISVSLALAIGQVANKGRTAQTLIIDEGFGALDEVNRSSLVEEFRHLSSDILQGGCVIVVSHQDEVCEAFIDRYQLSKCENGFIEIKRNKDF